MATPLRALVVPPTTLRRLVRAHRGIGFAASVPHTRCYALPRAELHALADEVDLDAPADGDDPWVLLVAPDGDDDPRAVWRLAFHAAVHRALGLKRASGALHAATLRDRIHRIGQTEFDEARAVLGRDDALVSRDDAEVHAELAALFLELHAFDPPALAATFPGVTARALEALRLDVDDAALLEATRPEGAPALPYEEHEEPGAPQTSRPRPALAAESERAAAEGRLARAAVLEAGAAPAAAGPRLLRLAEEAARVTGADTDAAALAARLLPLARVGTEQRRAERALYDVERAVLDHGRPVRALRVGRWLGSLLRERPIVRLPCAEEARVVHRLSRALRRARRVALRREDKRRALEALEALHAAAQARLAEATRPRIEAALRAVELTARRPFEEPFARKLVEELVDRVGARGFFTLGELRDAVSRNRIKLPRLSGLGELLSGDALLQLDRRLARDLDGLYRPGEIYVRGLQKASSPAFGTGVGAALVRWVALPVLASFVVLEGLSHLVGPLLAKVAGVHVHLLRPESFVGLALFVLLLLHAPAFRGAVLAGARAVGRAVAAVVGAPLRLLALPAVQRLLRSSAARFAARPLLLAGVAGVALPRLGLPAAPVVAVAAAAFVAALLLAATRAGRRLEDAAWEAAGRASRALGRNLLPGLLALVMSLFGAVLEGSERAIHAVDEWLRLRGGDRPVTLWAKGLLAIVWGLLTYVIRLYLNVLVEPQVNPIKHFPVVTVSHKILLPLLPTLLEAMRAPLLPLGSALANAIAGTTVFLLPGAFGFLVWELKENWKLYGENQPLLLQPEVVGSHGETLRNLLVPGFHAGTIPKLYAKWRRATVRKGRTEPVRAELHHVEEALHAFVARELVAVAEALAGLSGATVGEVHLSSNRIAAHLSRGHGHAELVFEEQSGLVLASLAGEGLLEGLDDAARARLEDVLAGFYRLAAVDLVREQIEALLPAGLSYDVADRGLVVFREGEAWEATYPLAGDRLEPATTAGGPPALPALERRALVFGAVEIPRAAWERALSGGAGERLAAGPSLLGGLS